MEEFFASAWIEIKRIAIEFFTEEKGQVRTIVTGIVLLGALAAMFGIWKKPKQPTVAPPNASSGGANAAAQPTFIHPDAPAHEYRLGMHHYEQAGYVKALENFESALKNQIALSGTPLRSSPPTTFLMRLP